LVSLDAFRGATIAAMILVNNPGDGNTTFAPLLHAAWHGWTFTDLVFPFFLWMVGIAMTFSYARRVEEGAGKGKLLLHTLRRAALIFLLGLLLNGFPKYDLATLRIPGVLQRIAICYLIGSCIFLYTKWRGQLAAIIGLCTVYWMLMTLVPVPGYGPGVLQPIGNFGQWIDEMLLSGHMYSRTKVWDPEGLVSTLPAIANVLFGALFGTLLRKPELSPAEKTSWILVSGAILAFLGTFLNLFMPINKQLWTPSFAVFTSGLAALSFGCFYWLIDVQGYQRGTRWLTIYGMNAIAVYALSGILARLINLSGWRPGIYSVFTAAAPPHIASLLFALMMVGVLYLVAWTMHRRGWFLRL